MTADESAVPWLPYAHRTSPWVQLKAVVAGIGVAGFAAADALQHLGAHVTVDRLVVDDGDMGAEML